MSVYRVVVGDPLLAADPFEDLAAQVRAIDPSAWDGVVTRLEGTGGVHCVAVAYLPLGLAELALAHGGRLVADLP